MRIRVLLLLTLALAFACGDDDGSDSGDAAEDVVTDVADDVTLPDPVVFDVTADPDVETGCTSAPPVDGATRAKRVACADELLEGTVAMGREGDILLENSRVRFILRGGDESAVLIGGFAGGVIDGARHGDRDLIKELVPALDLATTRPTAIEITNAGGSDAASVRVLFEADELALIATIIPGAVRTPRARGVIDYELRPDEDVLRVTVTYTTREGTAMASIRPGMLALMGNGEGYRPGAGVFDQDGGTPSTEATMVIEDFAPGPREPSGAVAVHLIGEGEGGVTHRDSINIVQTSRVIVTQGETATSETRIGLGRTGGEALAAALDVPTTLLRGEPGDRVEVREGEVFFARTRIGEDGTSRIPSGDFTLTPGFGRFFEGADVAGSGDEVVVPSAPRGTLTVNVTAGGALAPTRVTVSRGGAEVARYVALDATDHVLPPGEYLVTVSHGHEYDIIQETITIADGGSSALTGDLSRVVDTTGWVAGDFHLHSENSPDSVHGLEEAVRIVAAEGLEIVTSSDHDYVTDYSAILAQAGVADFVQAVQGCEVSHLPLGHVNGYPLRADPSRAGNGAPVWFGLTPTQVFDAIREKGDDSMGGAIVQVNHPRRTGSGWFNSLDLDPVALAAQRSPEALGFPAGTDLSTTGFDVFEVWNKSPDEEDMEAFSDLLAIREAGHRFGILGNSDSHESLSPAGSPRTYVAVPDDESFGWSDVASSMRAGDMTISGGIFVTLEVMGPPVSGAVMARLRVQAAPWVSTASVDVYAGSSVVMTVSLDPDSTDAVRFDDVIAIPIGDDDFVLAYAKSTREARPMIRFTPFGMTNPINL